MKHLPPLSSVISSRQKRPHSPEVEGHGDGKWRSMYQWLSMIIHEYPWLSKQLRNEVNEFGFSPLTLDFEAFVRFIRQVPKRANSTSKWIHISSFWMNPVHVTVRQFVDVELPWAWNWIGVLCHFGNFNSKWMSRHGHQEMWSCWETLAIFFRVSMDLAWNH